MRTLALTIALLGVSSLALAATPTQMMTFLKKTKLASTQAHQVVGDALSFFQKNPASATAIEAKGGWLRRLLKRPALVGVKVQLSPTQSLTVRRNGRTTLVDAASSHAIPAQRPYQKEMHTQWLEQRFLGIFRRGSEQVLETGAGGASPIGMPAGPAKGYWGLAK